MTEYPVQKTAESRLKSVNFNSLEFGKLLSDHMLVAEFRNGGWLQPQIVPYGQLPFYPAMMALHYGQAVFEGMKAFRREDGRISLFRADAHLERFNSSLDRMCMPKVPDQYFIRGISQLVQLDEAWISKEPGAALYIRPFCFASEERLKIKLAEEFHFIILTSPAGPYQSKPFRLKVETVHARSVEGGTGFAKCAGNYGGSYYPMQLALNEGYDQVLWTDGKEHRYIDEAGMMNVMFIMDGKVVTPSLNSAILAGITRDSILKLARGAGMEVEERRIPVDEIGEALEQGRVSEAFGTGTAAVVAAITGIRIGDREFTIPAPGPDSVQMRMKDQLESIRRGTAADHHNWNLVI